MLDTGPFSDTCMGEFLFLLYLCLVFSFLYYHFGWADISIVMKYNLWYFYIVVNTVCILSKLFTYYKVKHIILYSFSDSLLL